MSPAIVLTGANGGLGVEITRYLLAKGYRNLALVCRDASDNVHETLAAADLSPHEHCFYADLADEASVLRLRDAIASKFDGAHSLINVAGGSSNAMSWKLPPSEFNSILNKNVLTTFLCTQAFIPIFRAQQFGRIINFSSIVAFTGTVGAVHYASAKAALSGLTRSLALELAPRNVTVNCLALGYFEYGLIHHLTANLQESLKARIPLGRFGLANEVGGLINYLIGEDGGYTTGQTFHVNGGLYL